MELDMDHGKGVIGIATAFLGRYREFDICVDEIDAPEGSILKRCMGLNVAHHFNTMIRVMLTGDYKWVWILGDDHVFQPGLLKNLLNRNVDIVVPLCLRRAAPFLPVIHRSRRAKNKPWTMDMLDGKTGLVDITGHACGNAGMLLRRHVCETMKSPWFEVGKTNPEMGGSDLYFCEKAKDAGFRIYIDTDNCIGHITHVAIWPSRDENNKYRVDIQIPGKP